MRPERERKFYWPTGDDWLGKERAPENCLNPLEAVKQNVSDERPDKRV